MNSGFPQMNKFKALLLPCVSRQKQIQKKGLKQKKNSQE